MGDYNVDNLLGVIASLRALGVGFQQAVNVCAQLQAVPGRMEKVTLENNAQLPLTLVDYAHTPDAVTQTLLALKPFAKSFGSQLWCVLGCGGDRDASKRPLMAAAAEAVADHVVITSDNPRSEQAQSIAADMLKGLKAPQAVYQELDRAKAIQHAVATAGPQDVILIAGKGHEVTQEIAGVKYPFDDRVHAQQALRHRFEVISKTGALS
jgi:UDP-N-acetylmuramoyl-L-alanyl-D-glutamate--2,6-diaminopimelate ligase